MDKKDEDVNVDEKLAAMSGGVGQKSDDIDKTNGIFLKTIVIVKRDDDDGLFVQKYCLGKGLVLFPLAKRQHR